ncbi:MAG: fructose-6-phosphate aldolase [Thermoplasmata archaeon]|nr:fructose-6-phosphate aldolase [Thermoplasmata archaeon]
MRIFLDTANIEEIREAASWGILDGVTTNPTLMAKEKREYDSIVKDIVTIVDGPISAEAICNKCDDIVAEATQLSKMHENIIVKIPMCIEGLKAVRKLSSQGVKTNVTLVFSGTQALLAAKAGANYVSPFVGRLDDISGHGMKLVEQIIQIFRNYGFKTQVIVASVRHPIHVLEAALMGADIATVPFDILKKMTQHSLTDIGIERFKADYEKLPKK